MIGFGIIGLGAIGDRLLPIFKDHEGVDVVSVYDINAETTKAICDKHGVEAVDSIEAMLADPQVDAVYLAVPPKFHKDLAIDIMKAGKHILCEKPLAGTIEEAKAMMDYAKGTQLVHGMNFPLFFGPGYAKLKELLEGKQIGDIKRLELKGIFPDWPRKWQINPWIDTKDQGGFVREVFTHFIQLVQDHFGLIELDATFVTHPGDNRSEVDVFARGHVGDLPMVFSGMTGVGHEEDLKLVIWGTEGVIELVNWRDIFVITPEGKTQIDLESYHATVNLISSFCQSVAGQDAPIVNFEAGYHAVRVVETLLGQ